MDGASGDFTPYDVIVVGTGPAGVLAALRAADLGARTALIARDAFGGMAGNDGPVPVRTLAHAARLMREASQLGDYGIDVGDPSLDYGALLGRVKAVVEEVRDRSSLRAQIDGLGVAVYARAGTAMFLDPHTIEISEGRQLRAERIILCTGGASRRLPVPGFELTATHSDAWSLEAVPESMLVVGAGATGAQVASVFNAFGTRVTLFEAGPRILATEDADVSTAMAEAFRRSGIEVHEAFGSIIRFETVPGGVAMVYGRDDRICRAEAALAVTALGWRADTAGLNLEAAGVETDERGFIRVDGQLRTSAGHIFAAGDVIGGLMLAPQALHEGYLAATHALGATLAGDLSPVAPMGSFTDPEYAQVGLTEERAREDHDVAAVIEPFASATRAIIDGRTTGFCKLVVDRGSREILGCHIVGERAVDIVQVAAVAIAAGMTVDALARIPLPYPTYAGILGRVAARAVRQLNAPTGPAAEGPPDASVAVLESAV